MKSNKQVKAMIVAIMDEKSGIRYPYGHYYLVKHLCVCFIGGWGLMSTTKIHHSLDLAPYQSKPTRLSEGGMFVYVVQRKGLTLMGLGCLLISMHTKKTRKHLLIER